MGCQARGAPHPGSRWAPLEPAQPATHSAPGLLTSRAQEPLAVRYHRVLGLQPAVWVDELLGREDHLAPGLPELLQELSGPRGKQHVVAVARAGRRQGRAEVNREEKGRGRGRQGLRRVQAGGDQGSRLSPSSHASPRPHLGNGSALLPLPLPTTFPPPSWAETWSP